MEILFLIFFSLFSQFVPKQYIKKINELLINFIVKQGKDIIKWTRTKCINFNSNKENEDKKEENCLKSILPSFSFNHHENLIDFSSENFPHWENSEENSWAN